MRMIDLSRELYHRTPTYPGQPPIIHGIWKTHEEAFVESGNVQGNCVMFFSMPDHGGTHIDAPRHFGKSGIPIDEYPLEHCYVKGVCLDLRHIAPKAEITPADLEEGRTHLSHARLFHRQSGRQRRGDRVAGATGNRPFRHRLHAPWPDRRGELARA
jgi:kynurenine formamidase